VLPEFLASVEATLLAEFNQAAAVAHPGDRGDNREEILREFLRQRLPSKYGVAKGQIITKDGKHSHSADIIIYDSLTTPPLYSKRTAIVPIEGVYGIIEVKSTLSKTEFVDAARKIEAFKRLAPRDLGLIETRQYVTLHRASRPFGIVFGFSLADNSIESLSGNWTELNAQIHNVDFFVNFATVLGRGILRFEQANVTVGEKHLLLGTDEFVNLVETIHKKARNGEPHDEIFIRVVGETLADQTFGRFFVYLLILLSRMRLNTPDLGQYLDPTLPMTVFRES
jgi:hypothetical protein